jgi:hypothetical protein
VTVRKSEMGEGVYEVKFAENPSTIAVATVNTQQEGDTATVFRNGPGEWRVVAVKTSPYVQVEQPIAMILP